MDIIKLDPFSYQPSELVETIDTKIWTERYSTNGDFEFRSYFIEEAMAELPEDTMVSHMETTHTMVVESHEIETAEDGTENVLIKGRTFEKVLEDRVLMAGPRGELWPMQRTYTPLNAAAVLIWNAIANTAGRDVTSVADYIPSVNNRIPDVGVLRTQSVSAAEVEWWCERGSVYPQLANFLDRFGNGVRTRRPVPGGISGAVSVSGAGVVSTSIVDGNLKLYIEVYDGRDLTRDQTGNAQVVFRYEHADFDQAKYLSSIRRLKNVAIVDSSVGSKIVYADPVNGPNLSGRNRRVMYINGGDVGDQDPTAFQTALTQLGETELKKNNREFLFDTEISPGSEYRYGLDYNLGDKVTLEGQYGFNVNMRVNEHIRTEDQEGDRGYPTLVLY